MSVVIDEREQDLQVPLVALERLHGGLRSELSAAFDRVLASSGFILGREVETFESQFADYCGTEHCVGVASGTAALTLTLQAAGVGPGDEVIVPAHTFIASALAVVHAGATPVLCDVDESSGLIDPEAARAVLTSRTVAVMPVHLYGQVADVDAIRAFADPRGLLVIEDACQAHGARYNGRRAGSLGAAAGFSFYPSKNLGALGDGGAVCTSDGELAARVRRLRDLGRPPAGGRHLEIGANERLDGLQAAMLGVKLAHLDAWNEARREVAGRYRDALSDTVSLLGERPESPCIYHLFPVRVEERDQFAAELRTRGVATGVHYHPAVHNHPAWQGGQLRAGEFPRAEAWAQRELSLPIHPHMRRAEIARVTESVREVAFILGGAEARS